MKVPQFFKIFILLCFLFNSFLLSQEPEQLKKQDVSKIMEQVLGASGSETDK